MITRINNITCLHIETRESAHILFTAIKPLFYARIFVQGTPMQLTAAAMVCCFIGMYKNTKISCEL